MNETNKTLSKEQLRNLLQANAGKTIKKAHRNEFIAKGVIWFFAGLTIVFLIWIIGYIMVSGIYTTRKVTYDVLDISEEILQIGDNPDNQVVFIVNSKVKVKDLTVYNLREFYTYRREQKWGWFTAQDEYSVPYALSAGNSEQNFSSSVKDFLLNDIEADESGNKEYKDYVQFLSSDEEMIDKVASVPYAIGFIHGGSVGLLEDTDINIIPVRRLSMTVNPGVLEIVNNKQFQDIEMDNLYKLVKGKFFNWTEISGIDLPVRLIAGPLPETLKASVSGQCYDGGDIFPTAAINAKSGESFFKALTATEGSFGLLEYDDIRAMGFPVIPVQRDEPGFNITWDFLTKSSARSGTWGGIGEIIINTFILIIFTLFISTPIGIFAAIYLIEYAKQGLLIKILRQGTITLNGIPSIIFGLFGFIFFVDICQFGIGFISATLSITLMILPTIIRTTEEALKSVPLSYREGSLALGATKLSTVLKVVLPAASPGILAGVILAVGRVIGETAVLLYTLGSNAALFSGLKSSARVLSLHLYLLFAEGLSFERAFATGAIMVVLILFINYATTKLIGRVNKMSGN